MKSFANTGNPKLNSTQTTVNAIIAKKQPVVINRIVEMKLNPTCKLNDESDLFVYATFDVKESGYYNISNQVCVEPSVEHLNVGMIQFGICDEEKKEFNKAVNSNALNTEVCDMLCYNFQTFKYLTADKKYICWLNVTSSDNVNNFQYLDEYSHLILIKI